MSLGNGRRTYVKAVAGTLALLCVAWIAGCGATPKGKRYPLEGEVVNVGVTGRLLTVNHGEIPGYMSAMTMSYTVANPKEVAGLAPGDKIRAELVVVDSRARLEKITLVEKAAVKPNPAAGDTSHK